MNSNIIFQISWPDIVNIISESKSRIRLILPSIHVEWVILLEAALLRKIDIKVCVNNTEKIIREGYGDDSAIKKLLDLNVLVNESSPSRISLISVDNNHFLYFPTSRIFEDPVDEGISNAIALDQVTAVSILSAFFPEELSILRNNLADRRMVINEEYQERMENVIEDFSLGKINRKANTFDQGKFQSICNELKINPPIEPDLKRAIDIYNLKVQFVELRFENGKITGKRVRIPKKALPFESPELKRILDAGMKIFPNAIKNKTFHLYASIQNEVKRIREKYLQAIKCRPQKSILIKKYKSDFQNDIDEINKHIETVKLKLINDIDTEIEKSKNRLETELFEYFRKNPPAEIKKYYSNDKLPLKVNDYVGGLMKNMKFPKAHELIEGMKLIVNFYDLTWDDFSDKELLNEFDEKRILKYDLDSIRQLSKAFKVRK
ncbi:MAG: hypothetical protein JXB49_18600 [Bacteroidales bacterium]|nr:hypothetical protein [Bacteroidales bacterium]